MSAATPIAELLGIDTSSRQIATGFEFRGQKFYWCAPTPNQREALLHGQQEFVTWPRRNKKNMRAALAVFLATADGAKDIDAIISEARAAIAAQGGAE